MNVPGSLPTLGGVARVLGVLLVLALVAPFVAYAVPGVVGAQHSFVVLSGSMEPSIATGDVVFVEEADPAAVETGDVITFYQDGTETPVTHRVVEVREGEFGRQFVTKGDANEDRDSGVVTEGELVGRVAFSLPLLGYVVRFGGTAYGFVALVVVPIGLLLATELRRIVGDTTSGGRAGDEPGADAGDDGAACIEWVTEAADPATTERGETMETTRTAGGIGRANEAPASGVDEVGESTAAGEATPANQADEASGDITLATGELRLALAVLAAVGPYSAWVAYATTTGWAVAAAVAANASLALVAALYLSGRSAGGGADEASSPAAATGGVDDGR